MSQEVCSYCGEKGHSIQECPKWKHSKVASHPLVSFSVRCPECGSRNFEVDKQTGELICHQCHYVFSAEDARRRAEEEIHYAKMVFPDYFDKAMRSLGKELKQFFPDVKVYFRKDAFRRGDASLTITNYDPNEMRAIANFLIHHPSRPLSEEGMRHTFDFATLVIPGPETEELP